MKPERLGQVEQLYHAALEHAENERGAFLESACAGDETLRQEVQALLLHDKETNDFLESPPLEAVAKALAQPSDVLNQQRYHLQQKIGEGGMGEVWQAEQKEPIRRRVAIKLVKAGMNTREVMSRFESERQALALMDHPAIAKVLDAGSTLQGAPYFVMEYVAGVPITAYCDTHRLSIRERLELFMQVCAGVQHAHQKAIIHRDLKPSNILVMEVDGRAAAKIIDFGVAKALTQKLTADTMFTRVGALVGTPEYMSPEQANSSGEDIDTRTDVYSLGVIFYELLAGGPPIELQKLAFEELLRRLREDEPPKPSTKIRAQDVAKSTKVAHKRQTEPLALAKQMRGDLDSIALKALEKDRSRRYGTASELAADIARYIRNEPVLARPASTGYRLRKYAQRHRVGVIITVSLILLLAGLAVLQAVQLHRITRERDRANHERDRANRITAFTTGMFKVSDPSQARGNNITAREILDKASKDIDGELTRDPELQAQMMDVMGNVYENLGLFSRAQSLFERSVEIQRRVLGPTNPATLSSMTALGKSLREVGRYPEAEKLEEETLQTERRVLGGDDPRTLLAANQLAWTLKKEGRYRDAEKLDRQALEIQQRLLPPESPQTLSTMNDLAALLRAQGDYTGAEKMDRQTLEIRRRVLGADHPRTLDSMTELASDLYALGLYSEAENVDRQTLELGRRVYGLEHPYTLGAMTNLANDLGSEGRYHEAENLGRQTLEIQSRVLGPEHPQTIDAIDNLAQIARGEGHYSQAGSLDRRAIELRQRVLGLNHPYTLHSMARLATDLEYQGSHVAAENLERRTLEVQRRILGPENPDTLASINALAVTLAHERKYTEAEKLAHELQEIDHRVFGPQQPETATVEYTLARIAALTGRRDEALSRLSKAVDYGLGPHLNMGMDRDADLKSLHGDPRFDKILADAKERLGAAQKPR